ncbi:MAG: hypothetical protein LBJ62_03975 [Bifidobacteriaceae bacterium]|nr:hypothetical protein [Bifidobacteriaceae bacterium]
MPDGQTLALVESPAQLLHALEYAAAWLPPDRAEPLPTASRQANLTPGSQLAKTKLEHPSPVHPLKLDSLRIAVLAPNRSSDRHQILALSTLLNQLAGAASPAGNRAIDWYDARRSVPRMIGAVTRLASQAGDQPLVGDPFSGLIQAILAVSPNSRPVIIDDGSATIEFLRRLAAHASLIRPASRRSGSRRLLGDWLGRHTSAVLTGGPPVKVFSVMPLAQIPELAEDLADLIHLTGHNYDWLKTTFPHPVLHAGLDLIGSSLTQTGVIKPQAYLAGLTAAARQATGPVRYLAHRRESDAGLALIAQRTGAQIVRPALPAELELRRGGLASQIMTLPTSTAFTLPLALSDLPVAVHLIRPEPDWIASDAPARSVSFLAQLDQLAAARLNARPMGS